MELLCRLRITCSSSQHQTCFEVHHHLSPWSAQTNALGRSSSVWSKTRQTGNHPAEGYRLASTRRVGAGKTMGAEDAVDAAYKQLTQAANMQRGHGLQALIYLCLKDAQASRRCPHKPAEWKMTRRTSSRVRVTWLPSKVDGFSWQPGFMDGDRALVHSLYLFRGRVLIRFAWSKGPVSDPKLGMITCHKMQTSTGGLCLALALWPWVKSH